MGKMEIIADKKQAGFTLVELAIVMIIIGLLIGGVLKGQELIGNARVASTVTQVKGIDAAVSTFRDAYNAFPGDMRLATTRLAGCDGTVCTNGSGDGRLDVAPNVAGANAGESLQFWIHLAVADMAAGIDPFSGSATFGAQLPTSPLGGGLVAGYNGTGAIANRTATATSRAGHYLVLRNAPGTAGAGSTITPTQAARVDRRMDDGGPNGGVVIAIGGASATDCASAGTVTGVYNEALSSIVCDLAFRIQQ